MPLDYFTDREIFEAVTLSMRRRDWLSWWVAEEKQRRDKVIALELSAFVSKIGISLGFYWARVTGLNVIDSPGKETAKKPNGIRFG